MGRRALLRIVFAALVAALAFAVAHAQSPGGGAATAVRESAVKAAFLYKFASFVEWPAGTFTRPDQPIVIAVSGDEDVATDLGQLAAGRAIEGRPVVVRRVTEGATAAGAQIVFFGERRDARLHESIEAVPGAVLVVTSQVSGLRAGGVLNFQPDNGRVRFSVSLAAAEARGLKLSSRLLSVAQNVEGRPR